MAGTQHRSTVLMTAGFEELVENSYHTRASLERGQYSTYVPYVPTDLEYDGTKELMDGWKESWGTCPACFMLKSASGKCDCG